MNEGQRNSTANDGKKAIRWEVFLPAYLVVGGSAVLGILNKDALKDGANAFFFWSLDTFGWLYQIAIMACVILTTVVTFSRLGSVRLGGRDAKPKYGFWTWFAMTLTGGVTTGIVTWGVNEPLIYYGNVWGELNRLGIPPNTPKAAIFSMARSSNLSVKRGQVLAILVDHVTELNSPVVQLCKG